MHIEVITERSGAEALRYDWNGLLAGATTPSVFLTPEWLLAWWDAYGADLEMHLIAVRDQQRLVGLFPLAFDGRRLQGWSNGYTDRFGPLVDAHADAQGAVEVVARYLANDAPPWSSLDLVPLSSESPVTHWLASALDAVGAGNRSMEWFRSPIVDLPDDPDALRASLGGSFRSTLRRKTKKAEGLGVLSEIRTDAAALDEALEVADESWAHQEGTGIGSTPANRRFYGAFASASAARGWLRVGMLRDQDGRAIAFELNLVSDGEAVNLKLGYRESSSDLSPGLVLRGSVVDGLIAEGVTTFDLLGSDEPYKLHWTDRTVSHLRLRAFPPTWAGRARHSYRHRIRPAAGAVLGGLRRLGGRSG